MTVQNHIIKRQLIELEIPSRLDRIDVQNRVARLFHDRLAQILDKHFSQKSNPLSVDKIESLELDLGTIHVAELEHDFIAKMEAELEKKLEEFHAISEMEPEEQKDITGRRGSDIDLIIYFLQSGSFPWWAKENSYAFLEKAFENISEQQRPRFREIIANLLRDHLVLGRCIYSLSDKTLYRILETYLLQDISALKKLETDLYSSFGSGGNKSQFRETWWDCLLLLSTDQVSYSAKDFEAKVIELFMDLPEPAEKGLLRTDLSDEVEILRETAAILRLIITQFFKVNNALAFYFTSCTETEAEQIVNQIELLENVLVKIEFGKQRTWAQCKGELALAKNIVSKIQEVIALYSDGRMQKNISLQLPPGSSNGAIPVNISPQLNAGFTKRQSETISNHIERIDELLAELKMFFNKEITNQKSSSSTQQPKSSSLLNRIRKVRANEGIKTRRLYDPFSDSDKIYIRNSGLVVLGPFLSRFFNNLGLADDKEFIDEAAAERACLILQYLVDGNSENLFEAQLPLNKILCGLELNQPINTTWTMDEEEMEASNDFLDAVIQNAPMWKNLSIDGFRQAYLQREGALSTRDGHWLLQVKRETYDIMVDKLPWTVQVVKLPWMEHLMFVEWQET